MVDNVVETAKALTTWACAPWRCALWLDARPHPRIAACVLWHRVLVATGRYLP